MLINDNNITVKLKMNTTKSEYVYNGKKKTIANNIIDYNK